MTRRNRSRSEFLLAAGAALGTIAVLLFVAAVGRIPADRPESASALRSELATYNYDAPAASTTTTSSARTAALRAYDTPAQRVGLNIAVIPSRLAAEGAAGAVRTVAALTREQDAALNAVMRDSNSLDHIFGQGGKHNLGALTQELGGQEAVVREAILSVPRSRPEGVFTHTTQMGGHSLTITGRMMNGVPRISNIWIPR